MFLWAEQSKKQRATGTPAKRRASQRPDAGHEELDSMQALLYGALLESTMPEQCRRRRTHQQLANASPSDESLSFFKNPSKTCRLRRRFPQFLLAHRFAIFRTSWWSRRFFYLPALPSLPACPTGGVRPDTSAYYSRAALEPMPYSPAGRLQHRCRFKPACLTACVQSLILFALHWVPPAHALDAVSLCCSCVQFLHPSASSFRLSFHWT